jgi:hypothetical protein
VRALLPAAVVAVLAAVAYPASAQIVASERGLLRQTIDGTVIEIDYSRPSMRGRDIIFGDVVPWGRSWTPGANEATTMSFSKPVRLDGVAVDSGAYSVWIEPMERGPWRLALHADPGLFHTAHPPLDEAAYTVELEPGATAEFVETLRFSFPEVRTAGATLHLDWGSTRLSVDVEVESTLELTVPPEEARRLEGDWEFGTPGESGMPLRLRYDDESSQLRGEWTQGGDDVPIVMVRQAEGIYQIGFFIGDRVGSIIDVWYFEFFSGEGGADDGRPDSFEVRDRADGLRFEGRRTGR